MDQFDEEAVGATIRANERLARDPRAIAAHYDRGQIVIDLSTGYQVSFAATRAQGLAGASSSDLAEIEISPSGYGLHWPKLDADLWLPALLEGMFGSRAWMAARLGAEGGKATSDAKAAAARENGKRGGRPRNVSRPWRMRASVGKPAAHPMTARKSARKPRLKRKAAAKASAPRKPARKASRGKPKSKSKAGMEWLRSQHRKAAAKRRPHGKVRA
jgi:hypothetical protein